MAMTHPLRAFRQSQDPPLTLEAVAKMVGSTKATIARIELGIRTPSLDLASRLSRATGVPLETFVKSEAAA